MTEYPQRPFTPPPGSLDLLLVRHGASAPFRPGQSFSLVDGHGDPELAPEGVAQAELVARRLGGEGVDAVYVTNLRRTAETAAPFLRRAGLVARVEPDLREVFLGEWEGGVLRQKVAEQDPLSLQAVAEERWEVIPGAESAAALASRVRGAVERLAGAHPDQRVVVFTHGGIIGEVLRQATGSRPFAFIGAENGSISQIVVSGDRWIVRRFNDTAHLTKGFATAATPLT